MPSSNRRPPRYRRRRRLRAERLETRTLLASDMAALTGTVFTDLDDDGLFEPADGETGLAGVEIAISGTDDQGVVSRPNAVTNANGVYRFDNLRAGAYQITQASNVAGYSPRAGASPVPLTVNVSEAMGITGTTIDAFDGVEQTLTAFTPTNVQASSSVSDSSVLGGTRDLLAEVTSATGIVMFSSNAAFRPNVLAINPDSSTTGRYLATWDGDNDATTFSPTGLQNAGSGVDLTDNGVSTSLQLQLGVDKPNQQLTIRIYSDAANYSEVAGFMPETGGAPTAELVIPLSGFTVGAGTGADFSNVGAVQVEFSASVDAADGQIDTLGMLGPTVLTRSFANLPPEPAIGIEKSTNGEDADSPSGPLIAAGSTVTFLYVVTNNGTTALGSVVVTDDQGLIVTFVGGDSDDDGLLDTDESWTYQSTVIAAAGPYQNVGTVLASPVDDNGSDIPGLTDVDDDDPSNHFGVDSQIDIEKSTNGQDADTGPGPTLFEGTTVTFSYVVTNPGNVELINVTVVDDNGTPTDNGDDLIPALIGGDTDADGRLDPGETWSYSASSTAVTGQYENIAAVSALDPLDEVLRDWDASHYLGEPVPPIVSKRRFLASSASV